MEERKYINKFTMKTNILDFIDFYKKLPKITINQSLHIQKIQIYKWNTHERTTNSKITWLQFNMDKIRKCQLIDTNIYQLHEYISPVIIIDTRGIKYQCHPNTWEDLKDINDALNKKNKFDFALFFPVAIPIKHDINWIRYLYNLINSQWWLVLNRKKRRYATSLTLRSIY